MQFSVFGLWQCCVIDSRVTCAVLMGWGQKLRLDLLTSFTLSALSAETNIVHHFLFLADTQMDGWCRAWRRMIEWVRESKSLVFCALTSTDGERRRMGGRNRGRVRERVEGWGKEGTWIWMQTCTPGWESRRRWGGVGREEGMVGGLLAVDADRQAG